MSVAALVDHVRSVGVALGLSIDGKLTMTGDPALVQEWLPAIRANKANVIAWLSSADPANDDEEVCRNFPHTTAQTAPASCGICAHFQRDPINPPGGMGQCLIDAPESRRPGTLWPTGAVECKSFATQAGEEGHE